MLHGSKIFFANNSEKYLKKFWVKYLFPFKYFPYIYLCKRDTSTTETNQPILASTGMHRFTGGALCIPVRYGLTTDFHMLENAHRAFNLHSLLATGLGMDFSSGCP